MTTVAYAMSCDERDAWVAAREAFWTSTGAERVAARRHWRAMIRAEQERLRRVRAEFAVVCRRAVALAAE